LIRSALGDDDEPQAQALTGLYAIPRCVGSTYTLDQVKNWLGKVGRDRSIPPHILYGLAWQETPATRRWQQFDTQGKTIVSPDGGIGMMQITDATALFDTNPSREAVSGEPPADTIAHLFRLAHDIDYNIGAGATVLLQKWAATPKIGNGAPQGLEHWYYALWAYNGWGLRNHPDVNLRPADTKAATPYQEHVLRHIANGYGVWSAVSITRPTLTQIGGWPAQPIPATLAPVHVDSNFDGIIDPVAGP
jgi:hypothetical protein